MHDGLSRYDLVWLRLQQHCCGVDYLIASHALLKSNETTARRYGRYGR
jgi:hypothetical protein